MGTPLQEQTFLILTALAAEPLYGYGVIQRVRALSEDRVQLRPGTLYGALDRLVAEGRVAVEREEIVGGRLRRYYRLTDQGVALLDAEVARLRHIAAVAERQLAGRRAPGPATIRPANRPSPA